MGHVNSGYPEKLKKSSRMLHFYSVFVAGLVFTLTMQPDELSSNAYPVINLAIFITFACYLLLPAAKNTATLFTNSAIPVVVLVIQSQLLISGAVPVRILFQVGLITLGLSLLLWSLQQLLEVFITYRYRSFLPVFVLSVIILLIPVWSGPLVDLYLPAESITNIILSMTPLTHFSVAAEYDYLRSVWFYQNIPYGSLTFNYPDLLSVIVSYFFLVIFLQVIRWRLVSN